MSRALAVDDVLNFLETVADLARANDISIKQAWHTLYGWFSLWYYATEGLIRAEQAKDESTWVDLVFLHREMDRMQARNGNPLPKNLPADVKEFLEDEARLDDPALIRSEMKLKEPSAPGVSGTSLPVAALRAVRNGKSRSLFSDGEVGETRDPTWLTHRVPRIGEPCSCMALPVPA